MRFATRLMSSVPMVGAGLLLTSVPQLSAQELNNYISLDTLTVYATRSEQSLFDVPGTTTVVDPNAAGNATAGTLADLFQFTPGVEVEAGPRRNGQTINIRGYDDEAIITLIDGRRQNFGSAHDGRYFIDPNLLKQVTIVKGASSAIYGGGAIGGVVAFETKEAADLLEPGQTQGMMASAGYRTVNNEVSPSMTYFGKSEGFDLLVNASLRKSGDIDIGNGETEETKDLFASGLVNLAYAPNEIHKIKLSAKASINDGREPNNGSTPTTANNPVVEKVVEDYQAGIKYAYNDPNNDLFSTKFHLYYNLTEVEETDGPNNTNANRVQTRSMDTIGFTIDNQSKFVEGQNSAHTLSYGFEIYHDIQKGERNGGTRDGVPNADRTHAGVYLQDEYSVSTAYGDFLIVPAARLDYYESADENGNSRDDLGFSPKLSATYKPNENLSLFASAAQAFRAANLDELYPSGVHFPVGPLNNVFVTTPDLKPETVTTFEAGFKYRDEAVFSQNDKLNFTGTAFASHGKDFITTVVTAPVFFPVANGGTTTNVNIDNARLYGFELESNYELNPVLLKLGLSYVYAEDKDTGNDLSNNVPLTFVADISYKFEEQNTLIGWRTKIAADNNRVPNESDRTDGYDVHDIYLRWIPEMQGYESLTVDLGIENVFDKAYFRRFAGLNEEGRSFVAKATYKW